MITNGVPLTIANLRDHIHARAHYFDHEARSLAISPSGSSILDWTQDYRDSWASINNPLGIWTDSGLFAGKTRGVISNLQVIQNTPTFAQIQFTITEPIFIFPLQFATNDNEGGMSRIQTLSFGFNIVNKNRVWSHDFFHGSAIDTMDTEIMRSMIHINFVNAPADWVNPPLCITPYNEFRATNVRIQGGPINPNDVREFNSQPIQLDSCPQQLLLFAKMVNDVRDSNLQNQIGCTDCFAQIERIRINYG